MTTRKTVLTKRLPDKTSKPVHLKKMSHKSVLTKRLPDKTSKLVLTKRLPDKTSKAVLTKCLPDKTSAEPELLQKESQFFRGKRFPQCVICGFEIKQNSNLNTKAVHIGVAHDEIIPILEGHFGHSIKPKSKASPFSVPKNKK